MVRSRNGPTPEENISVNREIEHLIELIQAWEETSRLRQKLGEAQGVDSVASIGQGEQIAFKTVLERLEKLTAGKTEPLCPRCRQLTGTYRNKAFISGQNAPVAVANCKA
jgi:hypothetical protein